MSAPPPVTPPVLTIRFWGTRGSLPAPLSAAAVRQKVRAVLKTQSPRKAYYPGAFDRYARLTAGRALLLLDALLLDALRRFDPPLERWPGQHQDGPLYDFAPHML